MKLKNIAAGVLLAAASVSAFAGDKAITVVADGKTHAWVASEGDGFLSGGLDAITFGGLSSGAYTISVTVSGQDLVLAPTTNLNGSFGSLINGEFVFYSSKTTGIAPFTLSLFGTAGVDAGYSGTYKVSAVPEPETYGMLLGGLALMGMVARRKAKKAA